MKKVRILDASAIVAKLNRMAFEIAERNFGEKELVLVGIDERGGFVSAKLATKLKEIAKIKVHIISALVNRKTGAVNLEGKTPGKWIAGKTVIIVDDVLYSGKTLFTSIVKVMELSPANVQAALLIDRGHRSIPVSADFVGLELATTLKQHVQVEVSADGMQAEVFLK